MAIGDGQVPGDLDASQVTAQALVRQDGDTIVKTNQITAQVLVHEDVEPYVQATQITAQALIQQQDNYLETHQITAQILVNVTQVSNPTADYEIRRSTVN